MTSLKALQNIFWQSVRQADAPPAANDTFVSRGALSGKDRLGIYRTAYWVRQVSALRELFPTVLGELGDDAFARNASRYVAAHPSSHWAIEELGLGFPPWLRNHTSRWLSELAAIDWARWCVFVAPDAPCVDVQSFQPARLPEAWVHVRPQIEVLEVSDVAVQRAVPGFVDVLGTTHLVIWRAGFDVLQTRIWRTEAVALSTAKQGIAFPKLCELLAGSDVSLEMPARVFNTFHAWLARGWVSSLS